MIPARGNEVWILAGYVDAVPQYQAASGGRVLPRRLATANAAARGYRACFRDALPAVKVKADTGTVVDWATVGDVMWYGFIFGIAWGGC